MSIHRRAFLQNTATATAAMVLASLDSLSAPIWPGEKGNGFELIILATSWGYEGSIDAFCAAAKKEGYDGIEVWWPTEKKAQDELFAALKKHHLSVGFLCGGHQAEQPAHLKTFVEMVEAATTQTIQKPLYINCHSGRDYFSFDQNKAFIDFTNKQSKQTGILICHETHRSRMLFAAHVARNFIEKYPDLRLTFDVSHWCNVHESMLADQAETVTLALERVSHIHARIGHPEGPQVNDPRAPEWEAIVKQHVEWWDKVVARKKKNGERMTILTEFGPPDYMPTLPYTRQPLADQWAVNVYMMQLLRKRYQ
ncbi:sugar phosphate isomerase/epimerase family protein [Flavihumibacter profundi]|uniref:sugar phosphate isomerase/epimerase family protein n=1 Tax=Flavihumibacter profundi TaxID=2716883 RepID=UPI001CC54692|nr:twin-arginine translocation signal domain-containing protein [Flavihumibacter profundi]MBZ5855975.1 sugar phosphate isomerase/epimerase [Flavihumibacter profundi]